MYVLIGADDRRLARARQAIEEAGRLSSSVIVSAPAADTDIMRCIAPYTGCAIAEYFRDRGSDALIVFDDIGAHAHALTNLAKFANHQDTQFGLMRRLSRLLDRSAQLSPEKGGGSLSALAIVDTLPLMESWVADERHIITQRTVDCITSIADECVQFGTNSVMEMGFPAISTFDMHKMPAKATQPRPIRRLVQTLSGILAARQAADTTQRMASLDWILSRKDGMRTSASCTSEKRSRRCSCRAIMAINLHQRRNRFCAWKVSGSPPRHQLATPTQLILSLYAAVHGFVEPCLWHLSQNMRG